jgi:UDP-N-acetyl-D-mannosaminuronic acid dehydrogenase
VLRDRIESKTHFKEGEKFFLVFCPERVLQTRGIEETKKLPQLIGAFSEQAYNKATEFFKTITNTTVSTHYKFLSPREAEIAKLITNMWRYVSFAFANEMWMIGEKQGVDIHKVIEAANYKYSRMAVPLPGPNVGGPCLFKDGRFLLPDVPFVDLIQTSFIINEGMPDYIWNCITKLNPNIKNVLILGASFKADCDDTRNSLSFKMRKVCKKHGVDVKIYDPHVDGFDNSPGYDHDAVIIMTPHNYFSHILPTDFNNSCIVADVWKHWALSGKTISGIYRVGDVK